MNLDPINLSAYAEPHLHELESGSVKIDGTIFWDVIRQTQGPVLELGCGIGRATIPLAERGIDITGLEFSAPSLAYARSKAKTLPIQWIEADVRAFHLETRYALIFARGCVFNHMLTLHDQESMLARVHEHLADGGQFLFDLCNQRPDKMVNELEETAWYTLTDEQGRQIYAAGTSRYDYERQLWIQSCTYRLNDANGEVMSPPWDLTLRYVMPQEMEALLHYNGFKILSRFVDYDGGMPDESHTTGMYICEKR